MERLRDQKNVPPEHALARRLVDAKTSSPPKPFPAERVLARIRASRESGPRRARRLRPAGVLAALLVLGLFSLASAMVGRLVMQRLRMRAPESHPMHATTPPVRST